MEMDDKILDILERLAPKGSTGLPEKNLIKDYKKNELDLIYQSANHGMANPRFLRQNRAGKIFWVMGTSGSSLLRELKRDKRDERQINLINQQTYFSKLLMIATTILGVGVFLDLLLRIPVEFGASLEKIPGWYNIFFVVGFYFIFIILATFVLILLLSIFSKSGDPFESYRAIGNFVRKHWGKIILAFLTIILIWIAIKFHPIIKSTITKDWFQSAWDCGMSRGIENC